MPPPLEPDGPPRLLRAVSNGEVPPPHRPLAAAAARRALAAADEHARRLGMSRRAFLRTSMGAATTLLALAACAEEQRQAGQASSTTAGGSTGPGGTFSVPDEATTDPSAADTTLGPGDGEVVIDVQTHFLDPDTGGFGRAFPQAACGGDPSLCFTIDRWADLVLGSSDTALAVLSAIPIVADDHPMSIEKMETARRLGEALCGDGRVLLQGEAFPQVGPLGAALDGMAELAAAHDLVAWKTYTHTGGGYSFLDATGEAFLGQVEALAAAGTGPSIVAVHKGLGADPADLGPAAAAHPDIRFLAYHSGFEASVAEGPFREDGAGADRLLRSLRDAGIGPGGNVWCELGSTWRFVLADPDAAAHLLGKLLLAVGPERILWGTDSIWYGSPQDQIEAFRAFEISPELQERFGYPALDAATKRRILGANAAELHGIDAAAIAGAACRFTAEERTAAREEAFDRLDGLGEVALGPTTAAAAAATFRREHPWFRR